MSFVVFKDSRGQSTTIKCFIILFTIFSLLFFVLYFCISIKTRFIRGFYTSKSCLIMIKYSWLTVSLINHILGTWRFLTKKVLGVMLVMLYFVFSLHTNICTQAQSMKSNKKMKVLFTTSSSTLIWSFTFCVGRWLLKQSSVTHRLSGNLSSALGHLERNFNFLI